MSSFTVNNVSIISPSGSIIAYLGNTDPPGWIIANGIGRTNSSIYDNLVTMGIGSVLNGSYYPPNLLAAFLRGIGTSPESAGPGYSYAGPSSVGIFQGMSIQSHNHETNGSFNVSGGSGATVWAVNSGLSIYTPTTTVGNNETRPFNYGVNWIIKL